MAQPRPQGDATECHLCPRVPGAEREHHRVLVICSRSQSSLQITASQTAPSHYIILPIIVVAQRYGLCFSQTITKIILFCSLSEPSLPAFIPRSLPSFALFLWRAQRGGFPRLSPVITTPLHTEGSDHSPGQLVPSVPCQTSAPPSTNPLLILRAIPANWSSSLQHGLLCTTAHCEGLSAVFPSPLIV